ncbi:MAG TPA: hypothetical protein PLX66_01405 [Bacilli bacterium]|nr:hypothetical protein [Bacilli bacterium]
MKKKILIITIVLFLLVIFIGGYFLFFNNKDVDKNDESNDSSRVVSKKIDFSTSELNHLEVVADVTLNEALTSDEVMEIELKAYDTTDNLLYTYIASSQEFNINDETEIHLAFDDNSSEDLDKISYLTSTVSIKERVSAATDDYEFITNNNPEVVMYISLYRVFMDLSSYYLDNSGIATMVYADGTRVLDRISYLEDDTYIGVALENDFSANSGGSALEKVCVYRIAGLRKV